MLRRGSSNCCARVAARLARGAIVLVATKADNRTAADGVCTRASAIELLLLRLRGPVGKLVATQRMDETHKALVREYERVAKRQRMCSSFTTESIDLLLQLLVKGKLALASVGSEASGGGATVKSTLDELAKSVQEAQV